MEALTEKTIYCPYCNEEQTVVVDSSDIGNEYIEDCQICCKPIVFSINIDEQEQVCISVRDENEA
ncbi:CPXCG motif-containing cysteine-rich protein [Vibrio sp. SS-MA-C1-2]|uniref:CPXCG motif-containing cysteine-rich protein n=1 Tax=Vibrio sp. SS-MA-C1-2 TaxID=2908646 RepID=UPI001F421E7C|nr:CPXCG motif-containing cysteine-rich protein [Vibrio sp. SS-MA-C1-2]UJF18292.1 CPXCG motif-containing cysteine-rich protein [Vibrio sp. SS-MA-C1-2]